MTEGNARGRASDCSRACSVVLAGFYGVVNLGDEMILSVFVDWVRGAGGVPSVISVHPQWTSATLDVAAHSYTSLAEVVEAVADADLLVLGGGGLFQDHDAFDRPSLHRFPAYNVSQFAQFCLLARELGVPTAVLGQGVGPLRSDDARAIAAEVFTQAGVCSVRDSDSAQLLQASGVTRSVTVAPDPAWHFTPSAPAANVATRFPELAGRPVIAVAVRDWPFDRRWEQPLVAALRDVLPQDWACLWLDFSRTPSPDPAIAQGSEIAPRLISEIPGRLHAVWQGMHLDDAAALIASSDALIAMRLHAAILGHLAGLPVITLEYDEKVRLLSDAVHAPEAQRMPLSGVAARLADALRSVCQQRAGWRLDRSVRDQLRRSSCVHRELLRQAMAAAPRGRKEDVLAMPLLAQWVAAAPEAGERVTRALVRRLQQRLPHESR